MKVFVNKTKALLSAFVVVFASGFGIYYMMNSMYPEGPVFLIIAAIFIYLFYKNASIITVNDKCITSSIFGFIKKHVEWSDIQELGLIGENVFGKKEKKTGDKYIYFSPVTMTKDERFNMIVNWPPKNMLYIEYSPKAMEYVHVIWNKELKTYNVRDLFPDSEDK